MMAWTMNLKCGVELTMNDMMSHRLRNFVKCGLLAPFTCDEHLPLGRGLYGSVSGK